MSQTSTSIHTPTVMCGCPACLAAMGLAPATGSGSVVAAPAKVIPLVVAPTPVSDLTLGSTSATVATASSAPAPVAPIAPTTTQTPQRSGPVATQTFTVFGGDTHNTNGWDQEFGASFTSSVQGLTGGSGTTAYLAFTASAGSHYWFSAGLGGGTTMTIVDATGATVALDNTSTSNYDSFTALNSGTFFVKLSSGTNVSYNVIGGDELNLPPDPSTATTQDSFYSVLAGGGAYWKNLSSTAAITETNDGISNARHVVTFSFATSDPATDPGTGFAAMGPNEQAAVRNALKYISSLYDITFQEVAAGTGDIVYATNNQGATSAGYAFYPSTTGSNVYINNQDYGETASDYLPGTYGWEVLIHETGHALGLKHPGNYNAGGGGSSGPFLPNGTNGQLANTDNHNYTVMSYNDQFVTTNYDATSSPFAAGTNVSYTLVYDGNFGASPINPTSYMMYDFQALQYLYGANTRATSGSSGQTSGVGTVFAPAALTNQTFQWSANATLYETVYAVGANNTIDLSNQTLPAIINLNAGTYSSINERLTDADKVIGLPNGYGAHDFDYTSTDANGVSVTYTLFDGKNDFGIAPGSRIDTLKLGAGLATVTGNNDGDTFYLGAGTYTITAGTGNDLFNLGTGNATITGGGGTDTATIAGNFANYTVGYNAGTNTTTVTNNSTGKVDTLVNVASVTFNDHVYTPGGVQSPTVTITHATVSTYYANTIQASSLFTATDPSGTIDSYQLIDTSTAANSGHFRVNGVDQAIGATVLISASDLGSALFVAGTNTGTETISVRAFDSGNATSSTAKTLSIVDAQPVPSVTLPTALVSATYHQQFAASSLFTATDTGDVILGYTLTDTTANPTGYFQVNGNNVGSSVTIAASDLASTIFVAGANALETITVQASDHYSVTSPKTLSVGVTLALPTTSVLNSAVNASHLQSFGFGDLFTSYDAQGFATTLYDFYDNTPGNGTIFVNGVAQASGSDIVVAASALSTLSFVASGTDILSARVNDGHNWSKYAQATILGSVDQAPVVTAAQFTAPRPGDTLAASTLFTVTDAENDPIVKYQFYDAGTGGSVIKIGTALQTAGTNVIVNAADLANVTITAGTGSDLVYIKAYDGYVWSAGTPVTVTGTYLPPVVTPVSTSALSAGHLQSFGFSDLFTSSDPQGTAIVKYDLLDNTNGNGTIFVSGVAQPVATDVVVTAAALTTLSFVSSGSDVISARVYDGHNWSAYKNITITSTPDQAPVVTTTTTTALPTPRPGGTLDASTLFTAYDPEGDTITTYRFYDDGATGGRLKINGVLQGVGATVDVAASALGSVSIVAGTGTDTLYIKASDGYIFGSSWKTVAITGTNLPPVVSAISATVSAGHFQSFGFSDLFTTSDPQGSTIVKYDLVDTDLSGTGAHGTIYVNGIAQAAGTDVIVNAADLSSLSFVSSGSDSLSARVNDGFTWSAYKKITISGPADQAPVVTITSAIFSPRPGGTLDASSLFSAYDPEGDTIKTYRFYEDGLSGGRLKVNGVLQAVGAVVDVAASALNTVSIVAGTGTDTLYIKASDGYVFGSSWAKYAVTGTNLPPVVSAISATVSASHFQSFGFSDLFTTSDPQGATIVKYDLLDTDLSGTGNHGTIYLNGVAQAAGTDVIVAASALSSLSFVASGSDSLSARVWDGFSWSAYTKVTIAGLPDNAPVITPITGLTSPRPGGTLDASSLFTAYDPDGGDTIKTYRFYDDGAAGGRLKVNGVVQAAGAVVDVAASALNTVSIVAGTGTDTLYIKASDGYVFSGWKTIAINGVNQAPVVGYASTSALSAAHFQSFGFSDLFTSSDPQGSTIVKYDLVDYDLSTNGAHGTLYLNGVAQAVGVDAIVNASALSSLSFLASGSDALYARVYDGFSWSAYKKITISGPADQAPVITLSTASFSPRPGGTLDASSLFTAADPDGGDTIKTYRFYDDGAAGGRLKVNGVVQAAGAVVDVAASALSTVSIVAGTGTDTLYIKASDGYVFSGWKTIAVTGANQPPVVGYASSSALSATHLQSFGFSDLFTTSDPQGSNIVKYDLVDYDLSGTGAHGQLLLNGVVQAVGVDAVVNASALSTLSFVASGSDALYARVYDGFSWSAYKKVTVGGPVDHVPVITPTAASAIATPRPGGTLDASSLFSAADPDVGDSVVKYTFYDDGAAGGRLKLNGVVQAAGAVITVAATDLGTVSIVAGTGTDTLYVKAGDGFLLSGWTTISVTGKNLAPVTTAISASVAPMAGTVFHFSDLFSTSGQQAPGTATRYDFYDATTAGGAIKINGVTQAAGLDYVVAGSALSSLTYVANGNDTLYARYFDGFTWSSYAHVALTGPAASPPPAAPHVVLPVMAASLNASPLASSVSVASLASLDPNKHGFGFAAAS